MCEGGNIALHFVSLLHSLTKEKEARMDFIFLGGGGEIRTPATDLSVLTI